MPFDEDLDALLDDVAGDSAPRAEEGEAKDAVLTLEGVTPESFGLSMIEMDGTDHESGDVDVAYPIQSISKVFALVLVLRLARSRDGLRDELWSRVGREPSGDPFNSLVQLEHEEGVPRNPMINSGAIVVDDLLLDACDGDPKETLRSMLGELVDDDLAYDDEVLEGEGNGRRGHRNLAMAYLMSSLENLNHDPHDVMDVYVHQCALKMTTRQLARAVRFLANGGVDPATGNRILDDVDARRVNALMITCGTYDAAGQFAFDVGMPCKSSVSGAIIGVVPGEVGVCAWSPPLDDTGNSVAGRVALRGLSERLGLSLFNAARTPARADEDEPAVAVTA